MKSAAFSNGVNLQQHNMCKKGSVLIVGSWILAILVIFAISLGHYSALTLRISNFAKNRLKARWLAKAGINRAILELNNDANANKHDALNESWADSAKIFQKITLDEDGNEFAAVSYKDDQGETKYGMQDEEAKINVNTATKNLLIELFSTKGVTQPEKLADDIKQWINQTLPSDEEVFKRKPLRMAQELLLVLEYSYNKDKAKAEDTYNKVKDLITVYGGNKININTASRDVLTVFGNSIATPQDKIDVGALVDDIISKREVQAFGSIPTPPEKLGINENLWNDFKNYLTVESHYFRINAQGNADGTVKNIGAVYERPAAADEGKFVYWHEN